MLWNRSFRIVDTLAQNGAFCAIYASYGECGVLGRGCCADRQFLHFVIFSFKEPYVLRTRGESEEELAFHEFSGLAVDGEVDEETA